MMSFMPDPELDFLRLSSHLLAVFGVVLTGTAIIFNIGIGAVITGVGVTLLGVVAVLISHSIFS